jgi:hypothetical protein
VPGAVFAGLVDFKRMVVCFLFRSGNPPPEFGDQFDQGGFPGFERLMMDTMVQRSASLAWAPFRPDAGVVRRLMGSADVMNTGCRHMSVNRRSE